MGKPRVPSPPLDAQVGQNAGGAPGRPAPPHRSPQGPGALRGEAIDFGDVADQASLALELDTPQTRTDKAFFDDFGARDLGESFEDLPNLDADLELATDARPSPTQPQQVAPPNAPASTRKKPVLSTQQAAEAFTREAQELRDLAGFGDTPGGYVSCARYALHVAVRLFVLRKEVKRVQQHAQNATAQYHAALASLGQALVAHEKTPPYQKFAGLFSAIYTAESQVHRVDQSLAQAQAETAVRVSALEQKRALFEADMAPLLEKEREAERAHKETSEQLRRAQGLEKRVEIELRALSEATVEVDANKLKALQEKLAERRQAVAAVLVDTENAQAHLGRMQRDCAQKRREIQGTDDEKRKLEGAARAQASAIGKEASATTQAHQDALRALAEAALGADLVEQHLPQTKSVAEARILCEEAKLSLDRYERARKLYHRKSVIKGAVLWGVLIVLGVFALTLHARVTPT